MTAVAVMHAHTVRRHRRTGTLSGQRVFDLDLGGHLDLSGLDGHRIGHRGLHAHHRARSARAGLNVAQRQHRAQVDARGLCQQLGLAACVGHGIAAGLILRLGAILAAKGDAVDLIGTRGDDGIQNLAQTGQVGHAHRNGVRRLIAGDGRGLVFAILHQRVQVQPRGLDLRLVDPGTGQRLDHGALLGAVLLHRGGGAVGLCGHAQLDGRHVGGDAGLPLAGDGQARRTGRTAGHGRGKDGCGHQGGHGHGQGQPSCRGGTEDRSHQGILSDRVFAQALMP